MSRCGFIQSFLNDESDSDINELVSVAFHFTEAKEDVIIHPVVKTQGGQCKNGGEEYPVLGSGKPKNRGG